MKNLHDFGGPNAGSGKWVLPEEDMPVRPLAEIISENLRIFRRRKSGIILFTFLGLLAGLLYTLPKPPVYQASVVIEVQPPNDDFLYSRDVNLTSSAGSQFPDYDMATQIRVLSTKSLLDRVVDKLNADPNLRIQTPEDRFSEWRKALRLPARAATARADIIAETAATVQVDNSRGSRVISIKSQSTDANLAAAFLNTMAEEYIQQSVERRWQSAQHTSAWLERQLDDVKVKLEKSEDELQGYASATNLVFTGDEKDRTNVADQKMSELQKELSDAQADRIVKQARYEMANSGRSDSMAQVLDDSSLRANDLKLNDLRRELADETQIYGPAHVRVKKLQAQIAQTEADQKKARDKIVERISNDFHEAERREKLLATDYQAQAAVLSAQAGKLTHYSILKREVEINRQLYESLLQKVKESAISAALRASNLQVIDGAKPAKTPSGPDLTFASICGLLLGLTGGVGYASARERMSTYLIAPGDIGFHLGLPELGLVPSHSIDRAHPKKAPLALEAGPATVADVPAAPARGNRSLSAEAYRALLTSILSAAKKRPSNVLIVASPGPGEGKTTVAANLALAFAESNRSVLLIDCDTRRPRLHRVFDVPNETGLVELLDRQQPLDGREMFAEWRTTRFPGVCLVPSGRDVEHSQALLHSRRFSELLDLARAQFDVVLIDTPPMMHLADARIIGAMADGVVMVVRSGKTSRESAVSVKSRLAEDGIPIFGVVLNDWNPKAAGYYGYESYAQYYNSYYGKEN